MFRLIRKRKPILLGRWNRKKPMVKLDQANHDHSNYRHTLSSYDSSMDVALAALQSFYTNPKK